jgi:hypothetical protein
VARLMVRGVSAHEQDHPDVGDLTGRHRRAVREGAAIGREHADELEQLERPGSDEPTVRLSLTDDVFLRSSNCARWRLGIPVPVE